MGEEEPLAQSPMHGGLTRTWKASPGVRNTRLRTNSGEYLDVRPHRFLSMLSCSIASDRLTNEWRVARHVSRPKFPQLVLAVVNHLTLLAGNGERAANPRAPAVATAAEQRRPNTRLGEAGIIRLADLQSMPSLPLMSAHLCSICAPTFFQGQKLHARAKTISRLNLVR